MERWARHKYQPNLPLLPNKRVTACEEHIALSREAAREGMVLLKNEGGLLPLTGKEKVALFGKACVDYVKGGGGSGDVYTPFIHNLKDGFREAGVEIFEPLWVYYQDMMNAQYRKGAQKGMTMEPPVPGDLLRKAKEFADVAIISISRFSGEGWDRAGEECHSDDESKSDNSLPRIAGEIFPKGDFYLTDAERWMIKDVTDNFDKVVVVLNVGGIIETGWIRNDDKIGAALMAWQCGMEGGPAAVDLLLGKETPSGRLPDTFAERMDDYPSTGDMTESMDYVNYTEDIYVGYRYFETIPGAAEKVVYPFGYGLSYTTFERKALELGETEGALIFRVSVKNTGKTAGKDVAAIYFEPPQGKLGKPRRVLGAFGKTGKLSPGEVQELELLVPKYAMASYDDLGKVQKSAYLLEPGEYRFYLGGDVRTAEEVESSWILEELLIAEQLTEKVAPNALPKRMLADGSFEDLPQRPLPDKNECIFPKMTEAEDLFVRPAIRAVKSLNVAKPYGDDKKNLKEVAEGKISLEEFMEQLSDEDLIHLLGGQPNTGVANVFGMGNLPEYGVPSAMTADGPAGVRLFEECGVATTAWPCATALAATWNTEILGRVGIAGGGELKENNLAVWLTPAVNIHRSPLCGRNFEYYSEDPRLAGKLAAAFVRGVQSNHVGVSAKHFCCNNKETNRTECDSRVSERALREIYLKAFEIIVRESDPWTIMSSYNPVNGYRTSENHELLEDILRGEWGFKGLVTTDWWGHGEQYKEILAGNDLKMGTGYPERVKKAEEMGALTRADLERCAKRVLELILKLD